MAKLSSNDIERYLEKPKERKEIVKAALISDFGSIFEGVQQLLGVTLYVSPRQTRENIETTHGYQFVAKRGDENNSFSLKHLDEGFVSSRGNVASLLGSFLGYRDLEAIKAGYKLFEKAYNLPMWLIGPECRDKGKEYCIAKYGSLLEAGQILAGVKVSECPQYTGQHWAETKGYRLTKAGDFAVVHLTEGHVAAPVDFYANIGACMDARGSDASRLGWDVVYNDVIGSDNIVVDTESVRRKMAENEAERLANEQKKFEKNKAKSLAIFNSRVSENVAHEIYAEYISKGREQSHFENVGLSPQISVVHNLEYFCDGDDKNNGRKFTAIILPLVKLVQGQYKIRMLHAIYLEKVNGVWDKANVIQAKQDLGKFSHDTGLVVNLSVYNNPLLYIGEGNETVASYYGAMVERYGAPNADFKCTNTASRLASADIHGYKKVRLLVDRDRSGTGMTSCMKKRAELESEGVDVEFLIPPSSKVPIYIYTSANEACSIEACIEECKYWRQIDADFKNYWLKTGDSYKSRYQAFVVVPDDFELNGIDYPFIIRKSEIDENVIGKGVDWDNVLKISPDFAFEIEDFYRQKLNAA